MNVGPRVRGAATPQDALAAIADGIDALAVAIEKIGAPQPTDQWAAWNTTPQPMVLPTVDVGAAKEELALLVLALEQEADPEERLALEAKIRLKQDALLDRTAPELKDQGDRAEAQEDGDGMVVDLVPVSEEKKQQRREFAANVLHLDEELSDPEMIEAYAQGGPLWLYYGNRDLVMQMPIDWRVAMIADVEEHSKPEAYEMARDVLKDGEPGNQDATMQWLKSQAGQ